VDCRSHLEALNRLHGKPPALLGLSSQLKQMKKDKLVLCLNNVLASLPLTRVWSRERLDETPDSQFTCVHLRSSGALRTYVSHTVLPHAEEEKTALNRRFRALIVAEKRG
jgi:hypothetical protein